MILVNIAPNYSGVEYHRLVIPFKNYPGAAMTPDIRKLTPKAISDNNITTVVYSRNIDGEFFRPEIYLNMMRANGVKIVIDVDDYWEIPYGHVLQSYYSQTNLGRCVADQIIYADHVFVTNKRLADTIVRELKVKANKISIVPNAIDPEEEQYAQDFSGSREALFWQGSVTHYYDLKMIAEAVNASATPIEIAGYDQRSESQWDKIGKLFNVPVIMRDAVPVNEYMNNYVGCGICLIPIEKTKFNAHKSNLKMLEAGWAKKPVIVTNANPYMDFARDRINCLTAINTGQYLDAIRELKNNATFANELAEQLHEDVRKNHLIHDANTIRRQVLTFINDKR